MARPRDHKKHLSLAAEELVRSLARFIDQASKVAAGGIDGFGIRTTPDRAPGQRGPGKNNPRLKSALKNYWANMTPAARKARVAKMQAGRGLKPEK